ncbi:HAMP domain-containing histidine kinase [bacterium]|nr:HAMP domain-containing histidine kinase [bacterium]
MIKSFRWSLKWQLLTAILGVLLPTLLLYTWIAGNLLLTALDRELTSRLTMVSNLAKNYVPLETMLGYLPDDETTRIYIHDVAKLNNFAQTNLLDRISILTNQGLVKIDTHDWTPGTATGISDTIIQNPNGALTRLHRSTQGAWHKMVLTRLDENHLLRLSAGSEMFAMIDRVRIRRTIILISGIILALGLSFGMAFWLGKRLSRLSNAFRAMQAGKNSIQIPVSGSDELAFLSRSFNEMTLALENKTQQERDQHERRISELKVLSAGIAHEIRNPLSAISGLAELLARQPAIQATADNQDLVNRILNEIRRLDLIVMDVMAYARQPTLLLAFIGFSDLKTAIREIDPHCHIHFPETSKGLQADRTGLLTMLRNLICNARQAAGKNGEVAIEVQREPQAVTLQISDNGSGIAPEEAQQIFQPFFTKKSNGTGLGLAISRNIAEAHGGTLTLAPSERGTAFCITLPQDKE